MEGSQSRQKLTYIAGALSLTLILIVLALVSSAVTAQSINPPSPYDMAPTPPVPPLPDRQWLGRGDRMDHSADFGMELANLGCYTEALSVTVGIHGDMNPLTGTFPISAAFAATSGYRYIRVVGGDYSDPACLPLLTLRYWYTDSLTTNYLYYWDNVDMQWKPFNREGPMPNAYDKYLYTVMTSDTLPALLELYPGMVFAWGHTTTILENPAFLPIIEKEWAY